MSLWTFGTFGTFGTFRTFGTFGTLGTGSFERSHSGLAPVRQCSCRAYQESSLPRLNRWQTASLLHHPHAQSLIILYLVTRSVAQHDPLPS